MLSNERALELLKGANPKNQDEADFVINYNKKSREAIKESLDRDRDYHNRLIQASKEMYSLLTATLPKDFFCKKQVSVKTAKKVYSLCLFEANIKFQTILHNPFLRKKYDILLNANPTELYYWSIAPELRDELFAKHFKVNVNKLEKIYEKYVTQDFIEKVKNIESKYDVHFIYRHFDAYQWITGYYEFKECAKYYGWE